MNIWGSSCLYPTATEESAWLIWTFNSPATFTHSVPLCVCHWGHAPEASALPITESFIQPGMWYTKIEWHQWNYIPIKEKNGLECTDGTAHIPFSLIDMLGVLMQQSEGFCFMLYVFHIQKHAVWEQLKCTGISAAYLWQLLWPI